MKLRLLLIISIVFSFGFMACEPEFDPNAEWTENMLVYGLIDQDDDTTFLRIQRCFLGAGNMIGFSQSIDSNTYGRDDLEVSMTEWYAEKVDGKWVKRWETGDVFTFNYTILSSKQEGDFFAPKQPIYYCNTKNKLDHSHIYTLKIVNKKTGKVVTSETTLISNKVKITSPTYMPFAFNQGSKDNRYMEIKFNTDDISRIYQARLRIYYNKLQGQDTLPMAINIQSQLYRNPNNQSNLTAIFSESSFRASMKEAFANDKTPKLLADSIGIFIMAGNEELANYININAPSMTIIQERPIYTNINGGIGIFASRRTNIGLSVPYSESVYAIIRSLNLGF